PLLIRTSSLHPRYCPSSPTRRSSDLLGPVMQEALGRNGNMTAVPAIAARVAAADPVWAGVYPADEAGIDTIPYYPYATYLASWRSEEHTSELQSRVDIVCRVLLEKRS